MGTEHIDLFVEGIDPYSNGDIKKAIKYWTKSIKIKPDYSSALNSLGDAYKKLGKSKKAIEMLSEETKDILWRNK